MSIHGGQPIPCWRDGQCARAWEGKNQCDRTLQQCVAPADGARSPTVPTATAPSAEQAWQHAAEGMWKDLLNFAHMHVPADPTPSIADKLQHLFLGNAYRADITGAFLLLLALVLFLL